MLIFFSNKDTLTDPAYRTKLMGELSAAEPMVCRLTWSEALGQFQFERYSCY